MDNLFYTSSAVAVISTALMITGVNPVHALLNLIVSLLAAALVFYTLGAPFIAALEVIVYAGAIMVLFVFVMMMLNLGPQSEKQEKAMMRPGTWLGPSILAAVLLGELVILTVRGGEASGAYSGTAPKAVGMALFGPYLVGVELASLLLLAALVGAFHLGKKRDREA